HDRTRSAFGSEYAEPELRVETSYPGLLERRNLRKRRRPLLPGNRKRPHLAALDVGKRNGEILEGHVHLPTDQVRYRRRRTLVWDVLDIESGNELELLAREVGGAATTGRGVVELTRPLLRPSDERAYVLSLNGGMHKQDLLSAGERCHRREVRDRVERNLVVQERQGDMGARDDSQGVPVRRSARHRLDADDGASAWTILHYDGLAPPGGEPLADLPREDADRPAGSIGDDHPDRPL